MAWERKKELSVALVINCHCEEPQSGDVEISTNMQRGDCFVAVLLATTLFQRALINILERFMLHARVDFHQLGFIVN